MGYPYPYVCLCTFRGPNNGNSIDNICSKSWGKGWQAEVLSRPADRCRWIGLQRQQGLYRVDQTPCHSFSVRCIGKGQWQ